jgi:hypothetical protein
MGVAPAPLTLDSACDRCLDTGIALDKAGHPIRCDAHDDAFEFSEAAVRLSARLWLRLDQRKPVDARTVRIARLLTHATFDCPLQGKVLRSYFDMNERDVKGIIEELRAEWVLPIGSRRMPPYGYYWITSPEEFKDWLRTMRGQAMSELSTSYRLYRACYPELAGQEALDFAEDFSRDLTEAIK